MDEFSRVPFCCHKKGAKQKVLRFSSFSASNFLYPWILDKSCVVKIHGIKLDIMFLVFVIFLHERKPRYSLVCL